MDGHQGGFLVAVCNRNIFSLHCKACSPRCGLMCMRPLYLWILRGARIGLMNSTPQLDRLTMLQRMKAFSSAYAIKGRLCRCSGVISMHSALIGAQASMHCHTCSQSHRHAAPAQSATGMSASLTASPFRGQTAPFSSAQLRQGKALLVSFSGLSINAATHAPGLL